jgi:hypothetical protein
MRSTNIQVSNISVTSGGLLAESHQLSNVSTVTGSFSTELRQFTNISATTDTFTLIGGKYLLIVSATWNSGNAQLKTLSDEGVTWIDVGSPITANGSATYDLTPGTYRVAITSATAVNLILQRIPGEV